ncbi:MAG: hypothetical protein EOP00_20910 [Pedobacter sp.]|nr:MAG: hypothetical protein EOP00_20910 [Pedobacter sp.]
MNSYSQISPFIYNCKVCPTPCDGVSKLNYVFENDAMFSEKFEQKLIDHINSATPFKANKTTLKGYPDIEVTAKNGAKFFIEVKVQQRTFMSVEKIIPQSGLKPSETMALNLSDLVRYFDLETSDHLQIFIFWVVLNRPCIVKATQEQYYYLLVDELKSIYLEQKENRRFRRKSGAGDVVNGEHKGVTVNYHFSLKELKLWDGKLI